MKIKDMTKVLEEFENLGKAFVKAKGIIDKEGIPRFYTRILADTETFVQEVLSLLYTRAGLMDAGKC